MGRTIRNLVLLVVLGGVGGCAAAALTAGGIAGGVSVDHTLSGIAYKTFTAPVGNVRLATLQAFKQMEIGIHDDRKTDNGWSIAATAKDRDITVDLEALSPRTTRMRVVVNKGDLFFKDAATGTEIIVQTAEKLEQQSKR